MYVCGVFLLKSSLPAYRVPTGSIALSLVRFATLSYYISGSLHPLTSKLPDETPKTTHFRDTWNRTLPFHQSARLLALNRSNVYNAR